MRTWRFLVGVGVSSVSLWSALPAHAEEPAKPVEAAKPAAKPTAPSKAAAKPKCKSGMVGIPPGTFTMGDEQNKDKAGRVTVAAFCIDPTEVTVAAYAKCVVNGKCTVASNFNNAGVAGRENHPISDVDENQATAYCAAQGLRLPTEEEWEYAARGTDGRRYPWGNEDPTNQLCWGGEGTCAVGSYPKGDSPFGLSDMAGNVWEWTSSQYSIVKYSYHSKVQYGEVTDRVFRGGSWNFNFEFVHRTTFRKSTSIDPEAPIYIAPVIGIRCASKPLP